MAEIHVVYINRDVPDSDNIHCGWKQIEIEVTVEVVRGHPGDFWTEPEDDEAEVIDCARPLTDTEIEDACVQAIEQPTPEPEIDTGDDDHKPF